MTKGNLAIGPNHSPNQLVGAAQSQAKAIIGRVAKERTKVASAHKELCLVKAEGAAAENEVNEIVLRRMSKEAMLESLPRDAVRLLFFIHPEARDLMREVLANPDMREVLANPDSQVASGLPNGAGLMHEVLANPDSQVASGLPNGAVDNILRKNAHAAQLLDVEVQRRLNQAAIEGVKAENGEATLELNHKLQMAQAKIDELKTKIEELEDELATYQAETGNFGTKEMANALRGVEHERQVVVADRYDRNEDLKAMIAEQDRILIDLKEQAETGKLEEKLRLKQVQRQNIQSSSPVTSPKVEVWNGVETFQLAEQISKDASLNGTVGLVYEFTPKGWAHVVLSDGATATFRKYKLHQGKLSKPTVKYFDAERQLRKQGLN